MLIKLKKQIKYASILRAVLQVWKAHEVALSVWMLEVNTLFNNISSLYKTSREILLETALNRRVFELVVAVDKTSKIIDSCWIINQQEGSISPNQSEYGWYTLP